MLTKVGLEFDPAKKRIGRAIIFDQISCFSSIVTPVEDLTNMAMEVDQERTN